MNEARITQVASKTGMSRYTVSLLLGLLDRPRTAPGHDPRPEALAAAVEAVLRAVELGVEVPRDSLEELDDYARWAARHPGWSEAASAPGYTLRDAVVDLAREARARIARSPRQLTYRDAGVDVDAGNSLVERIRPLAAATHRPEVVSGVGGFAALCAVPTGYRDPLLVSGADGVGTKLKAAVALGRHDTVGFDLVAMCVNDVLTSGAEPLLFLDYLAVGRLDVATAAEVVSGVARACQEAGCALVGGETAEMPGIYVSDHYDLAGFCVGVVERSLARPREDVRLDDVVVGLPSCGLHSNGHSLARRALLDELGLALADHPEELRGSSVGDELLRPTTIYARAFERIRDLPWKAAAHITGGGLVDNVPRMLGSGSGSGDLAVELDASTWSVPAVMRLIQRVGVAEAEMYRTFNMGLGMLVVVCPEDASRVLDRIAPWGARVVGRVAPRTRGAAGLQIVRGEA